jgi:hypothetical protein
MYLDDEGYPYYYNRKTGETQWQPPAATSKPSEAKIPPKPASAPNLRNYHHIKTNQKKKRKKANPFFAFSKVDLPLTTTNLKLSSNVWCL